MELLTALRLTPTPAQPAVVAFTGGGGKSSALFRLAAEMTARGLRVVTATTTRIAVDQIAQAPAHLFIPENGLDKIALARLLDRHGHCLLVGREQTARQTAPGERPKAAGIAPQLIDQLAEAASTLDIAAILLEADGSRMLPAKAPAAHEPVVPAATTLLVPILGVDAVGRPIDDRFMHRADRIRALLRPLGPATDGEHRLTADHAAQLLTDPDGGFKGRPPHARVMPMVNKADDGSRLAMARLIAARVNSRGLPCLVSAMAQTADPVRERWEPWAAVVLAAGGATRMGRAKQLVDVHGTTMVVRAARTALATDAARVMVVTGAAHTDVARALKPLLADHAPRLCVIHNRDWAAGQSTSVVAAVRAAQQDDRQAEPCGVASVSALLFLPVDQPFLTAGLLARLAGEWRRGADLAAPVVQGAIRGAPSIFDRRHWPALLAISGDVGGRRILQEHADQVAGVPADARELQDIDTPADLQSILDSAKNPSTGI